jgi:ubiquitin C-terminal hydrolase
MFASTIKNAAASTAAKNDALTAAMRSLFEIMDNQEGKAMINPLGFVHAVGVAFPFIEVRSQNDVHEMFMLFIGRISEELKCDMPGYIEPPSPESATSLEQAYHKLKVRCDMAWRAAMVNEYSPLTDLMHGQLLAQIVCGNCRHIHHNYEPFSVWEVQVVDEGRRQGQRPTLEDCFLSSMASETMRDWKCSKCDTVSDSGRILKLWRIPKVMVICLKRFKGGGSSGRLRKITTEIDVPMEVQMYPMQFGPNNKNNGVAYSLCAAAVHMGDIQFGHYHAICRSKDRGWVVINDGAVIPLNNLSDALKDSYMLFYELKEGL